MNDDNDYKYELEEAGFGSIIPASAAIGVEWLFRGLIPCNSFGVLMGESGIGKSTLAIDLAMSAATGTSFAGYEYCHSYAGEYLTSEGLGTGLLRPSNVTFIHGEGGSSLHSRMMAAYETRKAHCADAYPRSFDYEDFRRFPIRMFGHTCVGDGPESLRSVIKGMIDRQIYWKYSKVTGLAGGLIVVDTFAAFAGITNENDNAVVQDRVNALKKLGEWFDAAVLVIAHTKKGTYDMRGATSLYNAADFVLRVSKPEQKSDVLNLVQDKARHGPKQSARRFRLVPFGGDATIVGGDSPPPVVEWLDGNEQGYSQFPTWAARSTSGRSEGMRWNAQSDSDVSGFDVYMEAVQLAIMGYGFPDTAGVRSTTLSTVRNAFDSAYQRNAEANRKAFERAHKRAVAEGRVVVSAAGYGQQLIRIVE